MTPIADLVVAWPLDYRTHPGGDELTAPYPTGPNRMVAHAAEWGLETRHPNRRPQCGRPRKEDQ